MFIFTLLYGDSKCFMKGFKTFMKPFETSQKIVKTKMLSWYFLFFRDRGGKGEDGAFGKTFYRLKAGK